MESEKKPECSAETDEEYRVKVTSKKEVIGQTNRYKEVLKKVLDEQPEVPEETKRVLLQELLANFEAAVQANVLVNGQTWDEAPDVEEEDDLESLLDDAVVETARRRRTYPRKILPHVVYALKAERKLLGGLHEQTIKPQELVRDSEQENIMKALSAAAPGLVKQATQVMQSITTLQKQAKGLCEILNMSPSPVSLEIHREVLGRGGQSDALPHRAEKNRQPIKRAAEEAAVADSYVPLAKQLDGGDALQ